MAKEVKKLVKLTFIDDGDDLTDEALLQGLRKAKLLRKMKNVKNVKKRISPPATLKASDLNKKRAK